jgi:hypothetical protein
LGYYWREKTINSNEIANLFTNHQRTSQGVATLIGYSQVAKDKKVKQFFIRGIKTLRGQIKSFGEKIEESYLTVPTTWEPEVTNSKTHTFSDKLMMFHTTGLIAMSVGYIGIGVSQSPRVDLGLMYNKISVEIQLYSEDGANIMIKNRWLEQPPMA